MKKGAIWKLCVSLIAPFVVLSVTLSAFALDGRYVTGIDFWLDRGEISVIEEGNFNAMIKTEQDAENNCFYVYLDYTDPYLKSASPEDIYLILTVENDRRSYMIYIYDGGYSGINGSDASGFAYVESNFSESLSRTGKGKIFAAVEFVDSYCTGTANTIKCEYCCGERSHTVLDGYAIDMTPPEVSTTQKTTAAKSPKGTTTKASAATYNGSNKQSTTKFSGSGKQYSTQSAATTSASVETTTEQSPSMPYKAVYNNMQKSAIAATVAFIIIGALLLAYAALSGKKKTDDITDEEHENGPNEKPENEPDENKNTSES